MNNVQINDEIFIMEAPALAGIQMASQRIPVPGGRNQFMDETGMSLGPESWAPYPNSLTIGRNIESTAPNQVMVGNDSHYIAVDDDTISIDGFNVLKEIEDLKRTIKEQQYLIEALWDAPGMPGANQRLAELAELGELRTLSDLDTPHLPF